MAEYVYKPLRKRRSDKKTLKRRGIQPFQGLSAIMCYLRSLYFSVSCVLRRRKVVGDIFSCSAASRILLYFT